MKSRQNHELEPLFDVELFYIEGMEPIIKNGKVGSMVGSGNGRLSGASLEGEVEWTLFEAQGKDACESNLVGRIKTDDGGRIEFDSLGFFLRRDSRAPHQWRSSAAVSFQTEEPRYSWLNRVLGLWHGEFDMETYRHRYRVWAAQDHSPEPDSPTA